MLKMRFLLKITTERHGYTKIYPYLCGIYLKQIVKLMNKEERIKELTELRQLLLHDLQMTNKIEQKIGNTPHLDEMRNLYLDQLNEIDRELKKIE